MQSGDAKLRSRSDKAVIHVYDEAGNMIETYEYVPDLQRESLIQVQQAQFTLRKTRISKRFRTWTPNTIIRALK